MNICLKGLSLLLNCIWKKFSFGHWRTPIYLLLHWGSSAHFMSESMQRTRWFFFAINATVREMKCLAAAVAAKQINLGTITEHPPVDAKSCHHGTNQAHWLKICMHSWPAQLYEYVAFKQAKIIEAWMCGTVQSFCLDSPFLDTATLGFFNF